MDWTRSSFTSIEQVTDRIAGKPQKKNGVQGDSEVNFSDVFMKEKIRFSKHANERLADRNISLDENVLERLETGMNKAREKGLREPLVMVDNIAFIVNTKSNTVVTAVNDTGNSVFTNIDGAVIS